jgi:hypothetical protein
MAMAQHPLLSGTAELRAMLTLEPATIGREGYPLLLQTGETYRGQPLHDRQHPHDLFMELAGTVRQPIGGGFALEVYGAPVGEPALGPVAVPHRYSASSDPLMALSHHWQDSTHVSFGVVTLGVYNRLAKLEASWFNGREPDEDRTDFDFRKLDSASARLTLNPTAALNFSASYGYLDSAEALDPTATQHRAIASAMYTRPIFAAGTLAGTLVYAHKIEGGRGSDSVLAEANLDLDGHINLFGRFEAVEKTARDLVLPPTIDPDSSFTVGCLSLGALYDFSPLGPVVFGVGARGAVYFLPDGLSPFYNGNNPVSGMVYLRLRAPTLMQ